MFGLLAVALGTWSAWRLGSTHRDVAPKSLTVPSGGNDAANPAANAPGIALATPAALRQALNAAAQRADQGQTEVARQQMLELARRWPSRPEPLVNLAVLESRQNDTAQARQHLAAALRTHPAYAQAFDLMTRLNGQLAQQAYARALNPEAAVANPPALPWLTSVGGIAPDTPSPADATSPTATPSQAPAHLLTTRLESAMEGQEATSAQPGLTPPPTAARAGWPHWTSVLALLLAASVGAGTAWATARWRQGRPAMAERRATEPTPPVFSAELSAAEVIESIRGELGNPSARPDPSVPLPTVTQVVKAEGRPTQPKPEAVAPTPPEATRNRLALAATATAEPAPAPQPSEPEDAIESPEARLIHIYRLIGAAQLPQALSAAENLAHDWPTFGLAQLVYGDLLLAQTGSLVEVGQGARIDTRAPRDASSLRREAALRLHAISEPPPPGTLPRQVLQLAPSVRHLVAVDISRSRLYVLENHLNGPRVIAHHYVSIGNLGAGKRQEGDQRTPLGIYHITARLDSKQLGDFYGAGALPLNYPNDHDRLLGRTGANIWLHGTPTGQYARAPRATNGCIVLANDDLSRWLNELTPRHTPVIVAEQLDWVSAKELASERQTALALAESWRRARLQPDLQVLMGLYSRRFDNGEQGLNAWREQLVREARATQGKERQLEDLSVMAWHQEGDLLLIRFNEVLRGSSRGMPRHQYWIRESGQWKIFSEGVLE